MAAPPERFTSGNVGASLTEPIQRLTAEDRKRQRKQARLRMLGVGGGAVALVAVLLTALSLGLQHQRDIASPYSVDMTVVEAGWSNDGANCTFEADGYHITPVSEGKGITCFAPPNTYADFDAQTTARLVSGAASTDFGIAFRTGDSLTLGDGYIFEITPDGEAWISLVQNGTLSQLSPVWRFPAGVSTEPYAAHTLLVEARGSTLTCFVDGKQVGSYIESRFSSGRMGLFAGQASDVAVTSFSVTPR